MMAFLDLDENKKSFTNGIHEVYFGFDRSE
jgi:hypothetical protein